jgi:putative ABC transport system permease protein
VVGDIRREGKMWSVKPQVFMAATQFDMYPVQLMDLAVRTSGEPASLIPAVQKAVWALDRQQPVTNVTTLSEIISGSLAQRRFHMLLIVSFALLALVLALVGVYGVVSYAVSQRTQEIGIRIALGARDRNILGLVMGKALALLLVAMLPGIAGAYALSRFIESLLFGVQASDIATYAAVATVVGVVTAIACYIPARRASKVDPMVALRTE